MKSYDEVMEETERKTKRNKEIICRKIILEIEKYYNIYFPIEENKLTYGSFLQNLLLDPSFLEYQPKLLDLLEKYNYNEKNIIFQALIFLNQPKLPIVLRKQIEESFRRLPFCETIEQLDNGYFVETKDGDILETYKLSKILDNEIIRQLLNKNVFQGCCHQAVEMYHSYFIDADIITSELDAMFGGIYYHSYIQEKEEVIDLATNVLYKRNTFNTFYQPKVIQRIPSQKLKECISTLPEEKGVNHCKVLRLAIENKIRMEKES